MLDPASEYADGVRFGATVSSGGVAGACAVLVEPELVGGGGGDGRGSGGVWYGLRGDAGSGVVYGGKRQTQPSTPILFERGER